MSCGIDSAVRGVDQESGFDPSFRRVRDSLWAAAHEEEFPDFIRRNLNGQAVGCQVTYTGASDVVLDGVCSIAAEKAKLLFALEAPVGGPPVEDRRSHS